MRRRKPPCSALRSAGAARDGRGDVRGQRRHLGERRPEQSGQRLQAAGRQRDAARAGAADGAAGGRREAHERHALAAAACAGAEPGCEAGQPVQLQLEREQQRIEGDVARGGRVAVEHVEQAAERGEHPRRRVALGEHLQQRLAAGAGDARPHGLLADVVVRRERVDATDRMQLPAALVQHERDVAERLEPRPDARTGAPHALGDGADAAARRRVEVKHAVGLTESQRAQYHRLGLVGAVHPRRSG